jgi:short-subunit dehydrogenase
MSQAAAANPAKRILIVGATSAIALAAARRWAAAGAALFLVARNEARLAQAKGDLEARGAGRVDVHALDVDRLDQQGAMLEAAAAALGRIEVALIAAGTLPDQKACERDPALAARALATNAVSLIHLLTLLANRMEAEGSGTIAVISSVAGDRGRASNYVYGAAKAALSGFAEGLRGRLFKAGVHVLTIKPGFVDTPMTAGLALPRSLVASPDRVGLDIVAAVDRRRDVLYTPWFWRWVMAIIRAVPGPVFKRLPL